MKSNLKKAAFLITGVVLSGSVFAQTPDSAAFRNYVTPFSGSGAFRTWSIGINAGVLTPYTTVQSNSKQDFTKPDAQLGYGAYIKNQIWPSFGIQGDFFAGTLQGYNAQPINGSVPYSKFKTTIQYAASISGVFTLANVNWHYKTTGVQPYFTLGAGLMGYRPVVTSESTGAQSNFKNNNGGYIGEFYTPVGLGLKFNISRSVNLDLGYQINFVNSDNVDGYISGANNDKFSYAHAGLEFALGGHSKPQLATHNPVASMRTEYLMDEQRLQMEADNQKTQNDRLRDDLNATKSDLAATRNDLNTTNANLAKFTVDSDGDGVPDFFDKCPGTPVGTKVDGSGCPLPVNKDVKVYITEEDRKVVKEAINNLEFDFGKATIRDHSLPSLDKVAQLLIDKNFSLKLAGHTDNVGSVEANLKLSKDRAEAIKTYLVSKGANPSRIEATGYGKDQPIATNKTAAGRQLNRRVEFTLF